MDQPIKLRRSRDSQGVVLPRLWEAPEVRMEKVDDLWMAQAPMRQIGTTGYYEFCPHPRGQWTRIGSYFKRADAVRQTTRLMSGNYVWQAPHTRHTDFDSIKVPGQAVPWTEVSAIIAEHPSVKGE